MGVRIFLGEAHSMKKFSDTQPAKQEPEDDRPALKTGELFVLTGFVMTPSKKYPNGVAKINGYDLITKEIRKFHTTGVAIIHQLANMADTQGIDAGKLKEEVKVRVTEIKGEKGYYLSFADPE
jgi:hypothetical protein